MDARHSIQKLGYVSVIVNVTIMAVKIGGGLIGNCYALVADGIESASDIFSSIITWGGYHLSLAPADENHPYGHGRFESLAGVFSGLSLVTAAVLIMWHVIAALASQSEEVVADAGKPAWWTLLIFLVVIVAKAVLSRTILKENKKVEAVAVEGDAWHHLSDAITSAISAFGIMLALWVPGMDEADDYAAIIMGIIILFNASVILRKALCELIDVAVKNDLGDIVREIAMGMSGVKDVEKCRVRQSGTDFFLEMHLCVDPQMTVERAHRIGHDVKAAVMDARPNVADLVVHLEPYNGPIDHRLETISPIARA